MEKGLYSNKLLFTVDQSEKWKKLIFEKAYTRINTVVVVRKQHMSKGKKAFADPNDTKKLEKVRDELTDLCKKFNNMKNAKR